MECPITAEYRIPEASRLNRIGILHPWRLAQVAARLLYGRAGVAWPGGLGHSKFRARQPFEEAATVIFDHRSPVLSSVPQATCRSTVTVQGLSQVYICYCKACITRAHQVSQLISCETCSELLESRFANLSTAAVSQRGCKLVSLSCHTMVHCSAIAKLLWKCLPCCQI